jgi:hypothetical protein
MYTMVRKKYKMYTIQNIHHDESNDLDLVF